MWQVLYVNFKNDGNMVNQESIRKEYNLEFTQDKKVKMQTYLTPFIDEDKGLVDESRRATIVSSTTLYPFNLSAHPTIVRPMIGDFISTPTAFANLNGKDYIIFAVNIIKNPNSVLRLIPEEGEKESLRRLIDHETIANALKAAGYSHYKITNPEIYHVKNIASIIELMSKFYNGIPLADVTKLQKLEERVYSAKELTDMGLGELKLSQHGVEIPIIEMVAPDEFVFYSQNYEDWKKSIDGLVVPS
jgi:hypothetical protein